MQRPHDSVFERNPAFAELWPRLDKQIDQLLNDPIYEAARVRLEVVTRAWTKLTIMWDELQFVLGDPRYKELSDSLSNHIAKAQFEERYEQDLKAMNVPATHTFIPVPSNLSERLEILSDILASSLDQKLEVFRKLQAVIGGDEDLLAEKKFREAQKAEYRAAIDVLYRQLGQDITDFHKTAMETLLNQSNYLQRVKYGSVEKFLHSYMTYHDVATTALLDKATRSEQSTIARIYTPEFRASLERESREIRREIPQVEARLKQVNEEIAEHERRSTPEYMAAIAEYKKLKQAVEQAERDVDKLMHYKSTR
ncbi:protein of unknown function [Taphrina deformans PYCC 5710]|uniref:Uncharacterized protein n=1 Tax=Taphrina deformans (strain PYCC 5710 / ATCC 11124 / CBS 356.35 / IMI 108563 / JCM 9778 / NBRC 8474) TaxID=1097556 RepID=R4XBI9_TAPDE|nr:protein of unknown function [Taphrina deformans PYCC 5710]|eukprot:CCG80703.1 protein of unknown function [Taphrina deformans PYCC 5710]